MDGQNNTNTGNNNQQGTGANTAPNQQNAQNTNTNQNTQGNQQVQNNQHNTQVQDTEKMFTQADVDAMMAREKNDGRRSVLAELGLGDDLEKAKESIAEYNKFVESQKTEAQKQADALKKANTDKDTATVRAERAEAKLTAISKGVKVDAAEDVVTIALTKVSKDKSLESVLDDMAKNDAYSSFFGVSNNTVNRGTGTGVNGGRANNGNGTGSQGLGARLAQAQTTKAKSSFFAR